MAKLSNFGDLFAYENSTTSKKIIISWEHLVKKKIPHAEFMHNILF